MNKKRFVALLAAVVMVLGTVPVFGAETSGSAVEPNRVATDSALTITGDATVGDVAKPDTFVVTLPTAKAFDFYVDPYGLVGQTSGSAVEITEEASGQSAIVIKDDALAVIKNESNVDVVVDVNILIETSGAGTLNLVTDQAAVASGDATNMFLALVPGTTKAADDAAYVATGEAIAIPQNGTEVSFYLDAAIYEVYVIDDTGKLGYRLSTSEDREDNYDAVAFKLGGSVNKAADWSVFADDKGSISFEVVFDIKKADTEEVATDTALHGVVSGTAVVPYEPVGGVVKENYEAGTWTASSTKFTLKKTVDGTATAIANTEVASVVIEGYEDVELTTAGTSSTTVTIAQITDATDYDADSEDLVFIVTMNDGTKYKVVKAA